MSTRASPGGPNHIAAISRGVVAVAFAAAATMTATVPAQAQAQARFRRQRDYRLDFHALADATCPPEKAVRADAAKLSEQQEDPFDPNGRHVIRVTLGKGTLYEATMELIEPDGTRRPGTPVIYRATTCAQAAREATVAAVGFIPLDFSAAGGAVPASPCDEEGIRKRVEAARDEGREDGRRDAEREAYERGRLEGRKEGKDEITDELDAAIVRRMRLAGLPIGPRTVDPPGMPLPFAVSLGGVISIGYTLDVAPGVVIGAEWRPAEMFSLGVEARAIFPAKLAEFGQTPIPVPASLFTGLLAPCVRWKIFMGCAAVDIGVLWVDQGHPEEDMFGLRFAAGPRAGIDVPFAERFSVRVLGDLLFPIVRNIYPVEEEKGGKPFVDPIASGFLTAGLSVSF